MISIKTSLTHDDIATDWGVSQFLLIALSVWVYLHSLSRWDATLSQVAPSILLEVYLLILSLPVVTNNQFLLNSNHNFFKQRGQGKKEKHQQGDTPWLNIKFSELKS